MIIIVMIMYKLYRGPLCVVQYNTKGSSGVLSKVGK